MPVTRERVDPIRDPSGLGLVHRRWILPDDLRRPVPLTHLSRLWRGLLELGVLDAAAEVQLVRLGQAPADLPAPASPGALLAGAGTASFLTQVVWVDDEGRRDPYALEGESDPEGFRDYTIYAIDAADRLLLPIPPRAHVCGACGTRRDLGVDRFGEGAILDLRAACRCGAAVDPGRDRAELRTGAVFLLEEVACRAALSVELPRAPASEELPDAKVAELLAQTLGSTDELADDGVPAAE